jgi:hypothetical protein
MSESFPYTLAAPMPMPYCRERRTMPNEFEIEADESGFVLVVSTTGGDLRRFGIPDGEAFYDHVKSMIGPWLYERDMAAREHGRMKREEYDRDMYDLERMAGQHAPFECGPDESGGYEADDPKFEGYHERMSVAADDREKV